MSEDPRFAVTNDDLDELDRQDEVCPKCGLKYHYLSGQRYCPTCEFDEYMNDGQPKP